MTTSTDRTAWAAVTTNDFVGTRALIDHLDAMSREGRMIGESNAAAASAARDLIAMALDMSPDEFGVVQKQMVRS